jgi:hypothetical protein
MTFRYGRPALVLAPAIAAALWAWAWGAAPAPDAPKSLPAPESPTVRLFKPRPFPGIDDPQTTLGEALDFVGRLYDMRLDVNEEAFRAEQVDDVRKRPVGAALPKMASVSPDRVLRKILGRLPAETGAVYLVRPDHLEVTTRRAQQVEVWGRFNGPYLPLVHADFEARPLAEALQELSQQAGVSVVIDARAADKAKAAVSASFLNLPLDTAVRILAEMAGLKSALNDNVIYVSTEARQVVVRPDAEAETAGGVGLNAAQTGLFAPVRAASFDKRPLREALEEVLKPTDMKLVVDAARAGDKAQAPVTANLGGTTVEAAVRLLADMADLRPVIYDNVVYLTTKDNAAGFIKANKLDIPNLGALGGAGLGALGGGGLGGLGGGAFGLLGGAPASPR